MTIVNQTLTAPDRIIISNAATNPGAVRDIYGGLALAKSIDSNWSLVHKFGRNAAVGTTWVPVALGGVYPMLQPAAATTVRIKAGGDVADTAAGAGAREIMVQGLNEAGVLTSEAITTAGASASAATTTTFTRLFRAWVSESGVYSTAAAGSHVGDIVVENSAGTADFLTIDSTGYPKGQSEVGFYSVPLDSTAYLQSVSISVDSTKSADVGIFQRNNLLDDAAPYEALRLKYEWTGISGVTNFRPYSPLGPYVGPCDIGIMAVMSVGTAKISCDFELLLENTA